MNGLDYWQRQDPSKPLFGDMLWSRPENKQFAGKLLIVGGNAQGFAAPAEAYAAAETAGIGIARVLLPDVLQKTVGRFFAAGEFAPSTPSGSFGQKALLEMLTMAQWADGVLLDGDLGRNSETAILLESFVTKYSGLLSLSSDAADYFIGHTTTADLILNRSALSAEAYSNMLLVLSFTQLQKLAVQAHFATAFTSSMDFLLFITALHEFSLAHDVHLVVRHLDSVFVASNGQVSTTKIPAGTNVGESSQDVQISQISHITRLAAHSTVWWLQNPSRPYAALTTAVAAMLQKQ